MLHLHQENKRFSFRGYEAYQNRINRGYEAYQNRINRGYEAYQNRINKRNRINLFLLLYVEKNMKWINVNENYLDYLRKYEQKIPYTNYGQDKYKPFFGILFEKDEFYYITQISHAQNRHSKMKQQPDFFKIYDPDSEKRLIAVVNLNYMFPIPKKEVTDFEKSKIDTYRTFKDDDEKSKYINLLDKELKSINELDLSNSAKKLYDIKYAYPNASISKRCIDFKILEDHARTWLNDDNHTNQSDNQELVEQVENVESIEETVVEEMIVEENNTTDQPTSQPLQEVAATTEETAH